MAKGKKAKKRKVKVDSEGVSYIQATFNNIIVSICNKAGEVVSWSSAGKAGFKGSKKYTLCCPNGSFRRSWSGVRGRNADD